MIPYLYKYIYYDEPGLRLLLLHSVTATRLSIVPVAQHGPILTLLQWNTSHAMIRLHMNAGQILPIRSDSDMSIVG
jgi:hypothetical protein